MVIGPINEIEIQKWPMVPFLSLPRAHIRHFSIFYINFYIAYQWKSQKWLKRGHFLIYFYSGIFFSKTSQNWCIFVAFGRFWQNMCISEGGQNPGFCQFFGFLRILTPLWNEHILSKTTKRNKNTLIMGSFIKKNPE